MLSLLFAVLAGILTIAAPCILPMLPVILGASVGQTSPWRPAFIALGFVVSFSVVALVFATFTDVLGLDQDTLRTVAIVFLLVFGVLMIWSKPFEWLTLRMGSLVDRANEAGDRAGTGNGGGFLLGTTLGVVWTPCAGPVLGSILTVIATSHDHLWGGVLLVAYAIGAGIPMMAIAYGGQALTTRLRGVMRISHRLQQAFGVLVVLIAVAMYYQYDTLVTVWLSNFYPNGQVGF